MRVRVMARYLGTVTVPYLLLSNVGSAHRLGCARFAALVFAYSLAAKRNRRRVLDSLPITVLNVGTRSQRGLLN